MKTVGMVVGLILFANAIAFGQAKTITNFELEKYQQQRLNAEREYRENYKRLGFPSPEELDRQRDADMKARIEISEQLRQARLEKERIELEQRSLDMDAARREAETEYYESPEYYGGGYYGGYNSGRGRNRGRNIKGDGYRVTPFQVIPVPRQPRPQPMIRTGRRN